MTASSLAAGVNFPVTTTNKSYCRYIISSATVSRSIASHLCISLSSCRYNHHYQHETRNSNRTIPTTTTTTVATADKNELSFQGKRENFTTSAPTQRVPARRKSPSRPPPPPPPRRSRSQSGPKSSSTKKRIRDLGWNKIFFQSLGCPRNWVDTEVMLGLVLQAGYQPTSALMEADYIILNTCGFLQAAREESTNEIKHIIQEKKHGSKLIVTGCMINLHKEEIIAAYPGIDCVLGSASIDKVLDAIAATTTTTTVTTAAGARVDQEQEQQQQNHADASNRRRHHHHHLTAKSFLENGDIPRVIATPKHYAYLKIAEGCRKRCSFCIIPKVKGRLRSKSTKQILKECHALLQPKNDDGRSSGVSELILIAQDLGDYGKDRGESNALAALLREILQSTSSLSSANGHKIDDDFWLRLMYLYPDEITNDLIDIIRNDDRVCRYVDMPIQHINNDILKRMKRKTTGTDIRRTIDKLRARIPGMHIRTSLMVGFPGETQNQFDELLRFVKEVQLENVGVFMYSNEKLAWSSRLTDQIPEKVKEERYQRLMEAQLEVVRAKNQRRVDSREKLEVVVEGWHPEEEGLLVGRYYGQCPDIDGQVIINDIGDAKELPLFGKRYEVEVTDFVDYDLVGRIL